MCFTYFDSFDRSKYQKLLYRSLIKISEFRAVFDTFRDVAILRRDQEPPVEAVIPQR